MLQYVKYTKWINIAKEIAKTRGPKGPWVAHQRKKVKGHSGAIYTNVVHQILVEDL